MPADESAPEQPGLSNIGRWSTRVLGLTVALGLVVPFVVLLIQQFTELGDPTIPCCDYAVLDMGTRSFLRGEQLVGLYSREGWRHPGPAPFLWSAPFSVLPFRGFARYQIAVVVLHAVALGAMIAAFRRRFRPSTAAVLVTALAVFVWRFGINQFREPWNPYMAMSLVMVTVVAAAHVLTGSSRRWSVVFVVAGSMAAQTHMGAVPLVGAVLLLLLVMMGRHRISIERRTRNTTLAVGGVLWLLPIIDLVVGDHNLVDLFRHSGDGPSMSTRAVGRALVWMMSMSPGELGRFFGTASAFEDGGTPSVFNWALALVCVIGGALVIRRRAEEPFLAWMVGISFVGIVLTTSTLLVADGPFIRYLMLPMLGLALLVWLSIVATVVEVIGMRVSFVPGSMIITLALTALVGTLSGFAVSGARLAPSYSNGFIDSMVAEIRLNCDQLPERAVIDVDTSVSWADAVSMVNQIDRCTETRATDAVGFISGQGFLADPDDEVNVRIGTITSLSGFAGVDIAAFDDVVVRVSN